MDLDFSELIVEFEDHVTVLMPRLQVVVFCPASV